MISSRLNSSQKFIAVMKLLFTQNYKLITVFLIFVSILSCEDSETVNTLLGTWQEIKFEVTECENSDFNRIRECTSTCQQLTFTETTVTFDNDPPIAYALDGNVITIVIAGRTVYPIYSISNDQLTITIKDRPSEGSCKSVYTYKRI